MKKNKVIVKQCPYFYKISNFEIDNDDIITLKLIEIYKNFIFSIDIENNEDLKMAEKLDFVLNKYIEDYYFRKDMKERLMNLKASKKNPNITKWLADKIIDAFESYESGYTRNIYFARWI